MNVFIPRSVNGKKNIPKVGSVKGKEKSTAQKAVAVHDTSKDDEVKEKRLDQRWPAPDEPVCIVCGRYGEYICDQTDEDVCSRECKSVHLQNNCKQGQCTSKSVSENLPHHSESSTVDYPSFDTYYKQRACIKPSNLRKEHLSALRDKLEIRAHANFVPDLMTQFRDCVSSEQLLKNLQQNNYVSPTAVQMQVVPAALHARDMMVSAATGSGKTASFLLPIVQKIFQCVGHLPRSHPFCKYPMALIVAPTRELCLQIEEHAKQLCVSLNNMKTAVLIGGCPIAQQLHRLGHNIQIVVGTPGRMNDLLANHEQLFDLQQVKMVVLDEVDVIMHLGFLNQVESITAAIPGKPQYLLFSATIPPAIEKIAKDLLEDPVYVTVGPSGLPCKNVKQLVLWVPEVSKKKRLFSMIEDGRHFLPPVLVFVDSKLGADLLCEALVTKCGLHCASLHSDKTQTERTDTLQQFLGGAFDVLIATNIMARGLDLANVKQVVIFDMPASVDEYVHQIGRAGGLGTSGYSIAFINNSSKHIFSDIKELFAATGNKLPDEVLHSPYALSSSQRKRKKSKESNTVMNRDVTKEINSQNLLEILTKHGRR